MDFSKLLGAIDKTQNPSGSSTNKNEEGYWKPTVDKAGNGTAIIRFLPDADPNEVPFVRIFSHGFKSEVTGRWYIENSLTTLDQKDPVGELNRQLWNSGLDEDKEQARKQKRRINYHSNILVLKDPGNPENEGKVFKYKYGQKIFDKIVAAAKPEFEDDTPVNVFDPVGGANFKMKVKKVSGFPNYDDSQFDSPKPLFNGDADKIAAVLKSAFSLQELLAPTNFKSYSELERKLNTVLGLDTASSVAEPRARTVDAEEDVDQFAEAARAVETPKKKVETPSWANSAAAADDDDMDFFKSLAED